mmetsp:Transcript_73942/g.146579  ORF Transcript_73942/g.146579 Transcript_73942/m.146579 type:complete len:234 (+) Transcript_73942:128-829(+)
MLVCNAMQYQSTGGEQKQRYHSDKMDLNTPNSYACLVSGQPGIEHATGGKQKHWQGHDKTPNSEMAPSHCNIVHVEATCELKATWTSRHEPVCEVGLIYEDQGCCEAHEYNATYRKETSDFHCTCKRYWLNLLCGPVQKQFNGQARCESCHYGEARKCSQPLFNHIAVSETWVIVQVHRAAMWQHRCDYIVQHAFIPGVVAVSVFLPHGVEGPVVCDVYGRHWIHAAILPALA